MSLVSAAGDAPVIIFGAMREPMERPSPGSFPLARSLTHQAPGASQWSRHIFTVGKADPVTTRVLQLWRPEKVEQKIEWLADYAKRRPLDPLLCWLVVMRAVNVTDVYDALGEYGWSRLLGAGLLVAPSTVRFVDVAGDVAEFRRRLDWSLETVESAYGYEWLDRQDASILMSACEAAIEAEREDRDE